MTGPLLSTPLFDTLEAKLAEARSRAPKGSVFLSTTAATHEVPVRDLGFDREAQAFFYRDEESDDEEETLCVVPFAQIEDISFPQRDPRGGPVETAIVSSSNRSSMGWGVLAFIAIVVVLLLLDLTQGLPLFSR